MHMNFAVYPFPPQHFGLKIIISGFQKKLITYIKYIKTLIRLIGITKKKKKKNEFKYKKLLN